MRKIKSKAFHGLQGAGQPVVDQRINAFIEEEGIKEEDVLSIATSHESAPLYTVFYVLFYWAAE